MMNHRTRFDWLYLFSYQVRHASVRRYIISLKNVLKFIPGLGKLYKSYDMNWNSKIISFQNNYVNGYLDNVVSLIVKKTVG